VSPLAGMNVSFKSLFSDHPPTADRIKRLREKEWAR
jgi:Zn-dependent protease with chaperone function